MKKNQFSIEEHIANADDLAIAKHHLNKIFKRCNANFPSTHKLNQILYKILQGSTNSNFSYLQSELDSLYHEIATNEDFKKHGHVYYNLGDRYIDLQKK